MWHAVYDSAWQHPGIAWAAGAVALLALAVRRPARSALLALFALLELEILLDAWFTSTFSPVGSSGRAAEIAGVVFVILGDWRYFYLALRQGLSRGAAIGASLGVSFVVPLATGLLHAWQPVQYSGTRLFFVYELGAFVVVLLVSRARSVYGRRLRSFELVQYGLWAAADALILAGLDLGYLLRIVPNTLYYAAFVPFVVWSAGEEALV